MKTKILNLIKYVLRNRKKIFTLGKGSVTRYTLIEIKWLFSIYFHFIDTDFQDRFHTHAFNAIGWTISGGYFEEVMNGIGNTSTYTSYIKGLRYIPKLLNHKILKAEENTCTILFTGPYSSIWTEETEDWIRIIKSGQIELFKIDKNKNVSN